MFDQVTCCRGALPTVVGQHKVVSWPPRRPRGQKRAHERSICMSYDLRAFLPPYVRVFIPCKSWVLAAVNCSPNSTRVADEPVFECPSTGAGLRGIVITSLWSDDDSARPRHGPRVWRVVPRLTILPPVMNPASPSMMTTEHVVGVVCIPGAALHAAVGDRSSLDLQDRGPDRSGRNLAWSM